MEPVSLAVGVVPLAMNIVQVVSSIKKLVSTYKSASKEIRAVADKTTRIGMICRSLEVEIPEPDSNSLFLPDDEPRTLREILAECYSCVSNVHDSLKAVLNKAHKERPFISPVSAQYLISKAKIDKSLDELDDSLGMLDLYMTASTWKSVRQLKSSQAAALQASPSATSAELVCQSKQVSQWPARTKPLTGLKSSRNVKWNRTDTHWSSWFYLEQTVTSNKSEISTDQKDEHRSYLFGSPLFGLYVRLAMRRGPLSPISVSLDMPCVIFQDSDPYMYEKTLIDMPYDRAAIPGWLEKWKITPNTQLVPSYGGYTSLMGIAMTRDMDDAFSFFLEQAPSRIGDEPIFSTSLIWRLRYSSWSSEHVDCTIRYIDLRGPLLTLEESLQILSYSFHGEFFLTIFDKCADVFTDSWTSYIQQAWTVFIDVFQSSAHRRYCSSATDPPEKEKESWASALSRLLAAGVDIHDRHMCGSGRESTMTTSFIDILQRSKQPMDCLQLAYFWLDIVDMAGVDADRYLAHEARLYFSTKSCEADVEKTGQFDRRSCLEQMFDSIHPFGREPWSAEGTSDLLKLVPHFQFMHCSRSPPLKGGTELHRAWKRSWEDSIETDGWPLRGTPEEDDMEPYLSGQILDEEDREWTEGYKRACYLIESRFERRQKKKWRKMQKKQGLTRGSGLMPGAWEPEWWEDQGGF